MELSRKFAIVFMPDGAANDTSYNGIYGYAVDQKGRVANPFRQSAEKSGAEEWWMVVVWPWHEAGTCLRVFPPAQAEKLLRDLDAAPNADQGKGALKRFIGGNSIKVKTDGAGRFTIPAKMMQEADIKDQAVISGMWDKFEIWSPARHKKLEKMDAPAVSAAAKKYIEL